MVNLIRYSYPSLFALALFAFFIGCGDDEVVDDVGPAPVATPEGIIKGTIVDLVTEQGDCRHPSHIGHGEETPKR